MFKASPKLSFPEFVARRILGESISPQMDRLRIHGMNSGDDKTERGKLARLRNLHILAFLRKRGSKALFLNRSPLARGCQLGGAFCMLASPAHAMSLGDYVEAALENNYSLQSTTLSLESERLQQKITRGALLPSLRASSSVAYNRNKTINIGVPDAVDEFEQRNFSLSLSQTLFDVGVFLDQKASRIDLSRAELRTRSDTVRTINDTVNAYFGYLQALAQLRTTRLERETSRTRLTQIRRSFELGNVAKTDVLEAEANLEGVRGRIITQENDVRIALRALEEITLSNDTPSFDIRPNSIVQGLDLAETRAYKDNIADYNYDVLIADKDVESARNDLDASSAEFFPTLSLSASHSYSDSSAQGASTLPASGKSQSQSITVNASLPLFTGGTRIYGVKKAKADYRIARINYNDTRNRITADLDDALFNVNTNARSIAILRGSVTSSQQSYQSLKRAYELGTRSLSDLLGAEGDLYNAIRDYYNARYDYVINYTNLHQINGSLDREIIAAITADMRPFDPTQPLEIPAAEIPDAAE